MKNKEIEEAKETMKHWVEYQEKNKDKINKADELISIQETLLKYIDQLENKVKELEKENITLKIDTRYYVEGILEYERNN